MTVFTSVDVVLSYRSSNDAFTNQHSLIPPSFGGPQIYVALPRALDVPASESATTASRDSESASQKTVESSDFVTETGHDIVKDLFPDGLNLQQPDDLMSAAEKSSISAAGAGFDAALRRASAPEAAGVCNKSYCLDDKYVDASVTDSSPGDFHNGHTACSAAWHALNPGLSRVASDGSIASSVGSLLDSDMSGLVCRTAAVAGHSSFKTHALRERSLQADDPVASVDDRLTDKTETRDDGDSAVTQQHISSSDLTVTSHDNSVTRQHYVR